MCPETSFCKLATFLRQSPDYTHRHNSFSNCLSLYCRVFLFFFFFLYNIPTQIISLFSETPLAPERMESSFSFFISYNGFALFSTKLLKIILYSSFTMHISCSCDVGFTSVTQSVFDISFSLFHIPYPFS